MKEYYLVLGGCSSHKWDPSFSIVRTIEGMYSDAEALGITLSMEIIDKNNLIDESKFKKNVQSLEAWMKEEFYQIKRIPALIPQEQLDKETNLEQLFAKF